MTTTTKTISIRKWCTDLHFPPPASIRAPKQRERINLRSIPATSHPSGDRYHKFLCETGSRYKERFGLDLAGDAATVGTDRRRLRNARKQERKAA